MPLAVTHVLLTIILVDLYRDYYHKHSKYFNLHTIFIAGVAGLLPDIDVPLGLILGQFGVDIVHGSFTHTPWFALLFFIPAMVFFKRNDKKKATIYFVLSFGIIFHVFLDWFLGGGMHEGVMWLFPFSYQAFKLHLFHQLGYGSIFHAVDAIILLLWLWHEEIKHKISDFI